MSFPVEIGNTTYIVCEVSNSEELDCNGTFYTSEVEETIEPLSLTFWIYLGTYCGLVLFAGLASGLTLGLLSLDTTTLMVISEGSESEVERKRARALMPIVKRHHLLLVTLLLSNAIAVEGMPVFLDRLAGPVTAILVSVTAVLFFGEVIPQALCSRFGLAIGYYAIPIVYFLMTVTFVIAWPISKFLDCCLGVSHGTYYKRSELGALVDILADDNHVANPDPLSKDETSIIKGALLMRNKTVGDINYTRLENVYMININSSFDRKSAQWIMRSGKSRIPLFDNSRTNIVGLLIVKNLLGFNPDEEIPFRDLFLNIGRPIKSMHSKRPLYEALDTFQDGDHIAVVRRAVGFHDSDGNIEYKISKSEDDVLGVVTLEDIFEELIQEPIYDEADLIRSLPKSQLHNPAALAHRSVPNYNQDGAQSLTRSIPARISRQPVKQTNNNASINNSNNRSTIAVSPKTPLLLRKKSEGSNQFFSADNSQATTNNFKPRFHRRRSQAIYWMGL